MLSEIKKSNALIWVLGIALGALLFSILLESVSFYGSILTILALLILLTLLGIWSNVRNKTGKKSSGSSRSTKPSNDLNTDYFTPSFTTPASPAPLTAPPDHIFTNFPVNLVKIPKQSPSKPKENEALPKGVINEFSLDAFPKIPEVRNPKVEKEKVDRRQEIEAEIEEVLSKYRRSNLYQDYVGQGGNAGKSLIEQEEAEEKREAKPVKRLDKPKIKEKEEVKKHTWINVSGNKTGKGKVKFKEEEIESAPEETNNDNDDPDKEAEEYILRSNKKAQEEVVEEAEEDKKDEEEYFF